MTRNESLLQRRRFFQIAGAVGAGSLIASCSSSGGNTLRATWWGDPVLNKALEKALNRYQQGKGHPTIKTESLPFDGYWDKLATETAGHNTPDLVMQAASYLPEYAQRDALLDLAKYHVDQSMIDPGVRNFGVTGGKTYAVVGATNAMGLIYNTRLAHRSGFEPPDGPWTWDDLATMAKRMHAALGEKTWALQDSGGDLIMFDVYMRGKGKDLYDESGALAVSASEISEWLSYWDELRHAGAVPPASTTAQSAGQITESPMVQEKAVMGFGWTQDIVSYATSMKDPVKVVLPPYSASSPGLWINAASLWSGSAYSKKPEEVAKLIDFLISDDEAIKILGATLGAPPSAHGRALLRGRVDPKQQIGLDYMDLVIKHSRPLNRLWPKGFTDLRTEFGNIDQQVGFGKQSADSAARTFVDQARKAG